MDDEHERLNPQAMMISKTDLATLLVCVFALASCQTTQPGGARSGLFGASSAASVYISALQGGVVSLSGADLSNAQKQRALEAEYRALETSPSGQKVTWRDDDAAGEVVAAAPYQVGNQNCRQYRHSVIMDGKTYQARGAACRNDDGTWILLN
ncbi:surface antigen [Agrobacterium vitis]|nr:surface antigen [Agrobacterium vitis]MBE1439183.1 surface antigen [Agrobacterium vitis]